VKNVELMEKEENEKKTQGKYKERDSLSFLLLLPLFQSSFLFY
jgi:hypothetical protein